MSNDTLPPGAMKWRTEGKEFEAKWYLTFISIIFGVFISVWIQPIVEIFPPAISGSDPSDIPTDIKAIFSELFTERVLRGAVMFVMLICLWWWYGTFLGRVAPAREFWSYLYDFVSLSAFAVAFRMWGHPLIFPIIVFFAAALMLGRFLSAMRYVEWRTVQCKALITALIALLLFMAAAVGAIMMVWATGVEAFLRDHWSLVQRGTLLLLFVGIGATFAAVAFTEGFPFRANKPDSR